MISFSGVGKQYGPQILFLDANFQVNNGEKIGLVGPNGAGKSTIFRMVTGDELPDEGTIDKPKRMTLGYFRQDVGEMGGRSVLAEVVSGAGPVAELKEEMDRLEGAMATGDVPDHVLDRYGEVQARFLELGGYDLESEAHGILHGLGFTQDQVAGDVGRLSGGWKMRVALARILLAKPDVMLLDEPTNYLDIESIVWLEEFLRGTESAVVMTCHDREVMNRVVKKIIEIDGGAVRVYTGNYDFFEAQRALDAAQREAAYARQQSMLDKEMRFVERFKAHAAKAAQVQSRVKKLDKIERVVPPRRQVERVFEFKPSPRSGDEVVKVDGLIKRYGNRAVHDGLSLLVRRRERWVVMGENGTGKTTLLKLMAGVIPPDGGRAELGAGVSLGYYAQVQMEQLDESRTVLEELMAHAPAAGMGVLRNLGGAFGFSGDDVEKPVSVLSGGEKARLCLAKILYDAPNLLILDEPTNHLDIATKATLVRALAAYDGTLVLVSHDRAFLRAVATRVLELGPEGPHLYPGTYDEYVAATGREAPGLRHADA
ncbi:MAG: ABC-F family ATP-binding cassette domain-containing protein [Myxococcales bacterium]|nr:ABC-F family ATP-binding cassette domain-containing protein [Myxococcales bacterium]